MAYTRRVGVSGTAGSSSSTAPAGPRINSSWKTWYDNYLKRIEQYKGSSLYDQMLNNPYAQYQAFSPTIGDTIAGWFGSNAAEDRFYQERMTSADEYLSQLVAEAESRQYNSTQAAVARDAQAGINDTLTGSPTGQGDGNAVPPDETPPGLESANAATAANSSSIGSIASIGINFVQSVIGFAKSFKELGILNLELDSGEEDLVQKTWRNAAERAAGGMTVPGTAPVEEPLLDENGNPIEVLPAAKKADEGRIYNSRRQSERYRRLLGTVEHAADGGTTTALDRAFKANMKSITQDTRQSADQYGMPGYADDITAFGRSLAETTLAWQLKLDQMNSRLAEIEAEIAEYRMPGQKAEADFNEAYYEAADGDIQARAENEVSQTVIDEQQATRLENEVRKLMASFQKENRRVWDEMMQKVKGDGRWYNNIGMMLLPGLQQQFSNVGNASMQSGLQVLSTLKALRHPTPANIVKIVASSKN